MELLPKGAFSGPAASPYPSNSSVGTLGLTALQAVPGVLEAKIESESEDGEKAVILYVFSQDSPQFDRIRSHLKEHMLVIDESENS